MNGTVVEHLPVLLDEVLKFLRVRKGGVYVDGTLGLGGHSEQVLSHLEGTGQLIALDWDGEALKEASGRLGGRHENLQILQESFKNLPQVLTGLQVQALDGCLLDLGVSSLQLDSPRRGFSFRREGPLDMRMDDRGETTAADLIDQLSEEALVDLFRRYGEEKAARRIAAALVERRRLTPIRTTTALARIVEEVKGSGRGRIHPATQVFQALRIEVNSELADLEEVLQVVISLLKPGGRLVVISFHSLEDRIVKNVFRKAAGRCVCFRSQELCDCPRRTEVKMLTRKPVNPTSREIQNNPRARSAKLRAVEKEG
ncbi:MAG: 16S rRNA (cytosine(1402)-N(4))-methyltransferase RsmH [Acidobacteriota bacterium]